MIIINKNDALHKRYMLQILSEIAENDILSKELYFKGGTCAAMLDYLDRFSVDLDFDIDSENTVARIRTEFHKIFKKLNLKIDIENPNLLLFKLKYAAPVNHRNTLKIDAIGLKYSTNRYEFKKLLEINRIMKCQTKETMFANKLVAVTERYKKHEDVAGRDIYDIHHFFLTGSNYLQEIILDRTGKTSLEYFKELSNFIKKRVTTEILVTDLGYLLDSKGMDFVKKYLLQEAIVFVDNEVKRLSE